MKTRPRCIKSSLSTFLAALCMIFTAGSCGLTLNAQTIRIKLLNGKNGHPMESACVNVWVGNERKTAMALPTDENGVASLKLTSDEAQVDTGQPCKRCGVLGVANPVVKYSDRIKINTSYVSCLPRTQDYSWLTINGFSTQKVVQSGVATANACGNATALPEPGEIILFVKPLSLWEKMKE